MYRYLNIFRWKPEAFKNSLLMEFCISFSINHSHNMSNIYTSGTLKMKEEKATRVLKPSGFFCLFS